MFKLAVFTIEKLVNNNIITGLTLVAGKNKLNNEITNVNIIENPDSYEWFKAGDFLMTTGYIYKDDIELQKRLIKQLSEINCSGLGVKINRYWDKTPQVMLEEADKYNLPIIEIPDHYSLSQVINYINRMLIVQEDSLLKQYRSINDLFDQLFINDGDFKEIIELAGSMIYNPIVYLDSYFRLVNYFDTPNGEFKLANHFDLKQKTRIFEENFIELIPDTITKYKSTCIRKIPNSNYKGNVRILPVAYGKEMLGYVLVFEAYKKLNNLDIVTLEAAVNNIVLRQIKLHQIDEMRNRMSEYFYDDLLLGKLNNNPELVSLSKMHGLKSELDYVVGILDLGSLTINSQGIIEKEIKKVSTKNNIKIIILKRYSKFVFFIEVPYRNDSAKKESDLQDIIKHIFFGVKKILDNSGLKIGIGPVCTSLSELSNSYNLAQEVLHLSEVLNFNEEILFYSDYIGYHFLNQNIDRKEMRELVNLTIGPLYNYDKENQSDLVKTLEAFFLCNGNLAEASKTLFIHRNTLIYRMDKIRLIINNDLRKAEDLFVYQLSLHILNILNLSNDNDFLV